MDFFLFQRHVSRVLLCHISKQRKCVCGLCFVIIAFNWHYFELATTFYKIMQGCTVYDLMNFKIVLKWLQKVSQHFRVAIKTSYASAEPNLNILIFTTKCIKALAIHPNLLHTLWNMTSMGLVWYYTIQKINKKWNKRFLLHFPALSFNVFVCIFLRKCLHWI